MLFPEDYEADAEQERAQRLRFVGWLAIIIAIVLAVIVVSAHAESYSIKAPDGDFLTLFDEPCPQSSGWLQLRRAKMRWNAKDYEACWTLHGAIVIVLDEAGEVSSYPSQLFQKDRPL